jgi:hypothetical protein
MLSGDGGERRGGGRGGGERGDREGGYRRRGFGDREGGKESSGGEFAPQLYIPPIPVSVGLEGLILFVAVVGSVVGVVAALLRQVSRREYFAMPKSRLLFSLSFCVYLCRGGGIGGSNGALYMGSQRLAAALNLGLSFDSNPIGGLPPPLRYPLRRKDKTH